YRITTQRAASAGVRLGGTVPRCLAEHDKDGCVHPTDTVVFVLVAPLPEAHDRHFAGIATAQSPIMPQQIADGPAASLCSCGKGKKLPRDDLLQHKVHVVLPRIVRLSVEAYLPLRLVIIAKGGACGHFEGAAIQGPQDTGRLLSRPVKFHPA